MHLLLGKSPGDCRHCVASAFSATPHGARSVRRVRICKPSQRARLYRAVDIEGDCTLHFGIGSGWNSETESVAASSRVCRGIAAGE